MWRNAEKEIKKLAKKWHYTAYTQMDACRFVEHVIQRHPTPSLKLDLQKDFDLLWSVRDCDYKRTRPKGDEAKIVLQADSEQEMVVSLRELSALSDRFIGALKRELSEGEAWFVHGKPVEVGSANTDRPGKRKQRM